MQAREIDPMHPVTQDLADAKGLVRAAQERLLNSEAEVRQRGRQLEEARLCVELDRLALAEALKHLSAARFKAALEDVAP